ncbi:MAG: hypothetical protein ABFS32_11575 [Bacteroidota bacterium]
MKKLITPLLIIMLCLSCERDIDESLQSSTGIIKETLGSYYQYGTHTLQTNTGDILFALKSNSINLDNYNDIYVEVKGSLIDGYPVEGGPEYMEVKTIKIID